MIKRGYKYNLENRNSYFSLHEMYFDCQLPKNSDIFKNKMTDRYFKQCYYNLQEKYDCGAITQEEWELIEKRRSEIDVED